MDRSYAERYRELYQRHWWWRAREAAILQEIRRLRPPSGYGTILDIGCGDGLFFDRLSEFGSVSGVEPDEAMLDPAGPHRAAIHQAPFDRRFQPGHTFGLILMLDVLEHLADPAEALSHAVSLLAAGGAIVLTVPAFPALWTRHDDMNHHVTRYTKRTLRRLAMASGMRVERERYLFQWLAPAKLALRAKEALIPGRPALPSIPPAPVNAILTAWSKAEQKIAMQVPLPFGSSLLVSGFGAVPGAVA